MSNNIEYKVIEVKNAQEHQNVLDKYHIERWRLVSTSTKDHGITVLTFKRKKVIPNRNAKSLVPLSIINIVLCACLIMTSIVVAITTKAYPFIALMLIPIAGLINSILVLKANNNTRSFSILLTLGILSIILGYWPISIPIGIIIIVCANKNKNNN